jgi:ribosome-binding ATPase
MSLSIGIVGLPNVGKSTLFNALTRQRVLAANYPFATIEPNVGVVSVPDSRLERLAELYRAQKIVPTAVTFVDIAGLVKGAAEGEGLGNKFLANVRESNAIVQVVRGFSDPNVTHVSNHINPKDDIDSINTELILADIQTIDRRLPRLEAEAKKDPSNREMLANLVQAREILNKGQVLNQTIDTSQMGDLNLLTAKPFIYIFNVDENDLANADKQARLKKLVDPIPALFLCVKVEAELAELPPDEAAELLAELGQVKSGLEQLIQQAHRTLGLQTFLTAGPKEVRAWTIPAGATAPEAAGAIHTDFQKGFIKAEVVSYGDLLAAGSLPAARAAGKVRLEGRDYVMQEGDVVEFRFNV